MIRKLFLPLAALALLGGCLGDSSRPATGSSPPPVATAPATTGPAVFADRTTLDERAASAAELAYKAARTACELAVDLGTIKGATATRFRELNRQAYAALGKVRAAYRAGNARSYTAALDEAASLTGALLGLTGRGN